MNTSQNFLILGLGSMGLRRHRCLKDLGRNTVYGFDVRSDRMVKAAQLGISTISNPTEFLKTHPQTIAFICVPPNHHQTYMDLCAETSAHFFVEAGVKDEGHQRIIEKLNSTPGQVGLPSATLLFHPAIQMISQIVKSGELGKISSLIYHSGQYLPDWHPYEHVSEFYVSNPATGAAKEIVPFELTWLVKVFGEATVLGGVYGQTITIDGASRISDTYMGLFRLGNSICNLTVDVVSRYATRRLLVNGSEQQLRWDWENDFVEIFNPKQKQWAKRHYTKGKNAEGYSENIPEKMYIAEIQAFLDSVEKRGTYPTDFKFDQMILSQLENLEKNPAVNFR